MDAVRIRRNQHPLLHGTAFVLTGGASGPVSAAMMGAKAVRNSRADAELASLRAPAAPVGAPAAIRVPDNTPPAADDTVRGRVDRTLSLWAADAAPPVASSFRPLPASYATAADRRRAERLALKAARRAARRPRITEPYTAEARRVTGDD